MFRSPRALFSFCSGGIFVAALVAAVFFPVRTWADEGVAPVVLDAVVTLTPPIADHLSSFPTASAILPVASSTVSAWVEILVSDADGWEDIDPDAVVPDGIVYTGFFKEDTVGPCAEGSENGEDDYQCYTPISFDACSLVANSTNEVLVSCPFEINYFTKPGSWTLSIDVFDRTGLTDNIATPVTVSEILAYRVDLDALHFGTVTLPISTTANSNIEIRFANAGNVAIAQLQVDHTDMSCLRGGVTPSGTIFADDLAYSTSSLGSLWDFAVTGTAVGEDFPFPIPPATNNTSEGYQFGILYNHLRNVDLGIAGTCAGAITFTPSS